MYLNLSLTFWMEIYLSIMDDVGGVVLNSVCHYFIDRLRIYVFFGKLACKFLLFLYLVLVSSKNDIMRIESILCYYGVV